MITLSALNSSKYVSGIVMLLMNLGSKYISEELSFNQDILFENKFIRALLVLALVFFATKDIKISIILTCLFIIIITGLLNEDSPFYILGKIGKNEGFDNKQKIRKAYLKAKKLIAKYEKQL